MWCNQSTRLHFHLERDNMSFTVRPWHQKCFRSSARLCWVGDLLCVIQSRHLVTFPRLSSLPLNISPNHNCHRVLSGFLPTGQASMWMVEHSFPEILCFQGVAGNHPIGWWDGRKEEVPMQVSCWLLLPLPPLNQICSLGMNQAPWGL